MRQRRAQEIWPPTTQALAVDVKATFPRVPVPACPPWTSTGQEPGVRGRGRHCGGGRRGGRRGARFIHGASTPQVASGEALPEVAAKGGANPADAAGALHAAPVLPQCRPHSKVHVGAGRRRFGG